MGGNRKGKQVAVPGCSRMPPSTAVDERDVGGEERLRSREEQSPPRGDKRRKTGIQLLNARRAAAEGSYVKATCSGSMSKVCEVFSTFDDEKRELVEDIAFGGMLRLPINTEVDPLVSLWLMRNVETSHRSGLCLHTRNVNGMICRDIDVHLMFGVPFEGAEIELGEPVSDSIVRVVRKLLHISVCNFPITMAEVREVLLKRYNSRMSHMQRVSFKIAVVLFVVTQFLAPNCYTNEFVSTEILKHLLDPDNIKNVNWAGYFIKCVKREAERLKHELSAGASTLVIHACPAIPKVFYLDNLAFGEQSPLHDLFPRINAYTSELMGLLVAADTKKNPMSSLDMFGITKVRDKSDVCYSRGFASRSVHSGATANRNEISKSSSDIQDMIHFGLKLIDEHAIKCSELLGGVTGTKELVEESVDYMRSQWISYSVRKQEANLQKVGAENMGSTIGITTSVNVGESSSRGAAANDQKMGVLKVESGKLVFTKASPAKSSMNDPNGGGFMETLNEIMQNGGASALTPEERAFYFSPADPVIPDGVGFLERLDEAIQQCSVPVITPEERAFYANSAVPAVYDGPPIYDASPVDGTSGHAPAGLFVGDDGIVSEEDIDEPEVPIDLGIINLPNHSQFGPSPFTLGLFHERTSPSICRSLLKMLEKTDAAEALRIWFRHGEPALLTISCSELRCVFYKEGRFSVIVVDGLSRLFTTLDRLMYQANGILDNMWRHWMPASFATAVIDGEDWLSPRFRDMLTGDHLGYNVANCRVIIMPLPRNGLWCTYVWDFLEKAITVLDPYLQGTSVERLEWEHDDTMLTLHEALFDCKDAWFQGWGVSRHGWTYKHPIALGKRCRDYNSGVFSMHYGLHFDGERVTDLSVEDNHGLVRADMLYKMLHVPGNTADLPAFLPSVAA